MDNALLPYNMDAELALVGSILVDPAALPKVRSILKTGDLYRKENQTLYTALLEMSDSGIDVDYVTLQEYLEAQGKYEEVGGFAGVAKLMDYIPTSAHVEHYANIVAKHGAQRRVLWALEKTKEAIYNDVPLETIRIKLEHWMGQATPLVRNTIDHAAHGVSDALIQLEQIEAGTSDFFLPCALHEFERAFGGYARGEVTVIGNFTGNGKTAFGLQEALDKARRGYGVMYISTEVYQHVLSQRLLSAVTQTNLWQVRRGWRKQDIEDGLPYCAESWDDLNKRMKRGQEYLDDLPIFFMAKVRDPKTGRVSSPDLTPVGVRAAVRAYAEKNPIDLMVADYITNFEIPSGKGSSDRSLLVELALRTLRESANEIGAAEIVMAQYTREANKSDEPRLHHLEQSTGIEKGADNVWLGYSPDTAQEYKQKFTGAKGRNSAKGAVEGIEFEGAIQTFTDSYMRRLQETRHEW